MEVTGPEEVAVSEEFSLEVSAKNTGGRQGDFTATLSVGDGAFSVDDSVVITGVPITKRKSTEIGPIAFDRAGEYTFRITDHNASHTVDVTTRELDGTATFTDSTDFSVSIDRLDFETSIRTSSGDSPSLIWPDSGSVFAVAYLSVQNSGDDSGYFSTSSLSLGGIGPVDQLDGFTFLSDIYSLDGTQIDGGEIPPGSSREGWLLFEPRRSTVQEEFALEWNRGVETTDPEVRWQFEAETNLPEFGQVQIDAPAEAVIGEEFSVSVAVTNTGSGSGTFRGVVQRRNVGSSSWEFFSAIELEVAAGETVSWSTSTSEPALGPSEYRILPTDDSVEIDFVSPRLSLGTPYKVQNRFTLTVDNVHLTEEFSVPSYYGEDDVYSAEKGMKIVLAEATVSVHKDSTTTPFLDDFHIVSSDDSFTAFSPTFQNKISSPVEGEFYSGRWAAPRGDSLNGWLFFEIPDSAQLANSVIRWESGDEAFAAEWTF